MNSFLLLGVLTSVPILLKIDQEMRPCECTQMDTQMQTDFIVCHILYSMATELCFLCFDAFSLVAGRAFGL